MPTFGIFSSRQIKFIILAFKCVKCQFFSYFFPIAQESRIFGSNIRSRTKGRRSQGSWWVRMSLTNIDKRWNWILLYDMHFKTDLILNVLGYMCKFCRLHIRLYKRLKLLKMNFYLGSFLMFFTSISHFILGKKCNFLIITH